jgi:hypothetical protein
MGWSGEEEEGGEGPLLCRRLTAPAYVCWVPVYIHCLSHSHTHSLSHTHTHTHTQTHTYTRIGAVTSPGRRDSQSIADKGADWGGASEPSEARGAGGCAGGGALDGRGGVIDMVAQAKAVRYANVNRSLLLLIWSIFRSLLTLLHASAANWSDSRRAFELRLRRWGSGCGRLMRGRSGR